MTKRDYYEILGVSKNSGRDEIKRAYKKLALQYHPDKGGDAEKFKEISEAYAVLSDDNKKSQYDQFGHAGFDQRFSQEDIFRNADFSSIFDEIFGNSGFSFGGNIFDTFFGRQRYRGEERGDDLSHEISIEFEDAVNGIEKEIKIPVTEACNACRGSGAENDDFETCSECNGIGQVRKKKSRECKGAVTISEMRKLKIKIPAGIDNGNQIRLKGKGNANIKGKNPGDLYVIVKVKSHEFFRRDGYDLHLETPISFYLAAAGGEIKVPILNGSATLKIPSGTKSGTVFRLKEKGIKYLN